LLGRDIIVRCTECANDKEARDAGTVGSQSVSRAKESRRLALRSLLKLSANSISRRDALTHHDQPNSCPIGCPMDVQKAARTWRTFSTGQTLWQTARKWCGGATAIEGKVISLHELCQRPPAQRCARTARLFQLFMAGAFVGRKKWASYLVGGDWVYIHGWNPRPGFVLSFVLITRLNLTYTKPPFRFILTPLKLPSFFNTQHILQDAVPSITLLPPLPPPNV
jgi:hypothetical protein